MTKWRDGGWYAVTLEETMGLYATEIPSLVQIHGENAHWGGGMTRWPHESMFQLFDFIDLETAFKKRLLTGNEDEDELESEMYDQMQFHCMFIGTIPQFTRNQLIDYHALHPRTMLSQLCGFIEANGTFWQCSEQGHSGIADVIVAKRYGYKTWKSLSRGPFQYLDNAEQFLYERGWISTNASGVISSNGQFKPLTHRQKRTTEAIMQIAANMVSPTFQRPLDFISQMRVCIRIRRGL